MPHFPNTPARQPPGKPPQKMNLFRGHGFALSHPPDWQDQTLYTITGPVVDQVKHNIIIMTDRNVEHASLSDYAKEQVEALENVLPQCRILKKGDTRLRDGTPAYRVIYRWQTEDNRRVYQEQIYVLTGMTGYKITSTFSKRTRRTLGPLVERIMISFKPQ